MELRNKKVVSLMGVVAGWGSFGSNFQKTIVRKAYLKRDID